MDQHLLHHRAGQDRERKALEAAFGLLGWDITWKRKGEFIASKADRRLSLELETVMSGLGGDSVELATIPNVALMLTDVLALPIPDVLTDSIDLCRPYLRPRLVPPSDLAGPVRDMCRRDAWGPLSWGVTIGLRSRRSFVTSRLLDRWGLEFADLMMLATGNLSEAFTPDLVCEVSGVEGLLAVMHDREPAASAVLLLDQLIPYEAASLGHVFSTPTEATLLAMPVRTGGGADALALLVQGTYAVAAEQGASLSDQIFWRRDGGTTLLPMTWVEESGSRRVHLEAEGEISDLLRILGEIE